MQRIGVFVCHCGSNISRYGRCKKVVGLAAKEPGVVHAEDYQYMCSEAGQAKIQEAIKEKNLTGVVVCSCSPRMHEATFRKAAERAGLNPYMGGIANIREHCSWIHKDMEEATKKAAGILARAAIAKVNLNTPLQPGESRVTKTGTDGHVQLAQNRKWIGHSRTCFSSTAAYHRIAPGAIIIARDKFHRSPYRGDHSLRTVKEPLT